MHWVSSAKKEAMLEATGAQVDNNTVTSSCEKGNKLHYFFLCISR